MNFDFPAFLVLASVVTGGIWLVDAVMFAPRRRRLAQASIGSGALTDRTKPAYKEPILVEYARSFFPVIFAVLVLRSFLVEPFRIPSNSMMPTLLTGDFILVNKFAYGLRWPVLNSRFLEIGDPQVGDVVVFKFPQDTSVDYIKRVIGVPGDEIAYQNKRFIATASRSRSCPSGAIRVSVRGRR
jgi:signal peptidase I